LLFVCFSIDNSKPTIINPIDLPRDFKTILTPGWQETIERYETVQVSRASKVPPRSQKRAPYSGLPGTRYGEFTITAEPPKPPHGKPSKIEDRVKTTHGTATIIKIDGTKNLVDPELPSHRPATPKER